ncbi:MAG: TetR/AcrR family transcriptional regulator [Alphaproteobacteria bacterium]|nr:TetR family transcriptional regulator [Hyphomonas sp.]MBR9807092.1 TetR/AcrR family transcriptional regulator [Alphaproteobacteria bacterium]|tara:strand:+ start:1296 stop:1997 length:702 start_codon:yes stop_codon:yes gene_type:complete
MPKKKASDINMISAKGRPEMRDVDLETKAAPSQDRARTTFEKILTVTGELLGEVGFERLSTNMICKHAGITPPALYRYFPNKYAILHELGERLTSAQEKIVTSWVEEGGLEKDTFEDTVQSFMTLMTRINEQNKAFVGGLWVIRIIRVTPRLKGVRVASRDYYAAPAFERLREAYPELPEERVRLITRLLTDVIYAAAELAIDEPEDEAAIIFDTSLMVASYYEKMREFLGKS